MTLEDVDPSLFGLICNWLYAQKLVDEHGENLKLIEYTWLIFSAMLTRMLRKTNALSCRVLQFVRLSTLPLLVMRMH